MPRDPVVTFTDKGIHSSAGDFHIDPWHPVARALITHGHADHARSGMGSYLATHAALPVIRHRLGNITAQAGSGRRANLFTDFTVVVWNGTP